MVAVAAAMTLVAVGAGTGGKKNGGKKKRRKKKLPPQGDFSLGRRRPHIHIGVFSLAASVNWHYR